MNSPSISFNKIMLCVPIYIYIYDGINHNLYDYFSNLINPILKYHLKRKNSEDISKSHVTINGR